MSKKWLLSANSLEDAMFIWKFLVIARTFQIEHIFAAACVYLKTFLECSCYCVAWTIGLSDLRKCCWQKHDWNITCSEFFLPGDCYYGVSILFDYDDFTLLVNVLCKLQFADADYDIAYCSFESVSLN